MTEKFLRTETLIFSFWQKDCADRKMTPRGKRPRGLFTTEAF